MEGQPTIKLANRAMEILDNHDKKNKRGRKYKIIPK